MTTTFHHADAGTPESEWSFLDELPPVVACDRRLIVLAAHPDDESLGAAGLIAASARMGASVTVVVATDGEGSHPQSTTHTPCDLAGIRRRELRAAVDRLAPGTDIRHLGLPDGHVERYGAALDSALAEVAGHARGRLRIVTPWSGDRHPDHAACAAAGERFAAGRDVEHWQYPIWLWHWGTGADLPRGRLRRLDLGADDLAAKCAALDEHVSQHRPLSDLPGDEPVLADGMLEHFRRPFECFVVPGAPASHPSYFEDLYTRSRDPWGLADRFYERRKRAVLTASLPRQRFRRAFEPGCATGELTAALIDRADEVVAWDVAAAALQTASERFADVPATRVRIERGQIPADWPDGTFDLIVLSEVGYYCDDLDALVGRTLSSLTPDGVVVACHWRRPAPDHPHQGIDVHAALDAVLECLVRHDEEDFRLDVWSRTGESVATAEGIV